MKLLIENGILFNGNVISVNISGFICDAPAKAEITYINPFNSYYGCLKCFVKGNYKKNMFYTELNSKLRTDESYRLREQIEHHKPERSLLEQLPINMVDDMLLDPMHVVYLGVMKKLIKFWIEGTNMSNRRIISVELTSGLSRNNFEIEIFNLLN